MASVKIYDSDGKVLNIEYPEADVCKLRIGTDWYEHGVMTNGGEIIAFDNMPDGWAKQVGNYDTPGYEFYPGTYEKEAFYPHSWEYAKAHGQEDLYINIYAQNVDCRNAIDDAISNSYDPVFGKLAPGTALPVIKEYGMEEVAYILSLTVVSKREDDGRLSMDNRFWSIGCNSYYSDVDYQNGNSFDITLEASSPALNKFISQFLKETQFDPSMDIIRSKEGPFPTETIYTGSYDYAIKNNEMPQYLWSWGLNCKCAKALDALIADPMADNLSEIQQDFGKDRVNLVLASSMELYTNNPSVTEEYKVWADKIPMPAGASIMERDGYRLRANADSLVDFLNENLPSLTNDRQDRPRISMAESNLLFNGPMQPGTFTYGLYQIVDHDCPYYGKASATVENFHPDPSDYTLVYCESVNGSVYNLYDMAEDIFEKFDPTNIDYPNDYFGRKASVSDVIIINDGYHYANAFYTDNIGFRDLPDFVNERRDMFLPPKKDIVGNSENKPLEQQNNGTLPDPISGPSGR